MLVDGNYISVCEVFWGLDEFQVTSQYVEKSQNPYSWAGMAWYAQQGSQPASASLAIPIPLCIRLLAPATPLCHCRRWVHTLSNVSNVVNVLLLTATSNGISGSSSDLASLFECPVCFDYALPPIMQCQSGHIVCSHCRPKLQFCPTCRGTLGKHFSLYVTSYYLAFTTDLVYWSQLLLVTHRYLWHVIL